MTGRKMFGAPDPQPVEDLAEPIRAWRGFQVDLRNGQLVLCSTHCSVRMLAWVRLRRGQLRPPVTDHNHVYWRPEGMEAICLCDMYYASQGQHEQPPGPMAKPGSYGGYGCGLYAMRHLSDLRATSWGYVSVMFGQVELGGRVWPHEGGYRAQYARVVSLLEGVNSSRSYGGYPIFDKDVVEMADRYGVPVIPRGSETDDGRDRRAGRAADPGAGPVALAGAGEGAGPRAAEAEGTGEGTGVREDT